MSIYLVVHNTYHVIECGLFNDGTCIASAQISKMQASSSLVSTLDTLLKKNNLALDDLSFCAVGQGPGPFTTLRTVIATMNGISFATGIPLIGINLLTALVNTYDPHKKHSVIGVLNAFGGDVYYAVRLQEKNMYLTGCGTSNKIAEYINLLSNNDRLCIVGNARESCAHELRAIYGDRIIVGDCEYASLETVAKMGIDQWASGNKGVQHLSPIYLKNHPAMNI